MILKKKFLLALAALIALATFTMAQSQKPAAPANGQAAAPAKKGPMAKTKEEFEAYKAAIANTDPAKLEAAANDFAQKYPASELRSILFQATMGAYQNANQPVKSLEMARAVLKYEPDSSVALLTAAQILSERTKESDPDKEDRYKEAEKDARLALANTDKLTQPANMTPEQFEGAKSQFRGTAHEVLGSIASRHQDYFNAIKEYNAAISEEKDNTDPVVWLRLAIANDKSNDYHAAYEALAKAISTSDPGSQVRTLAQQEKARLDKVTEGMIK
jgi:hypothetical protein